MLGNKNGITLIQMVVTITMIVLIAAFAVYNAGDTVLETKVAKVYNEMTTVKKAIVEAKLIEENDIFENKLQESKLANLNEYEDLKNNYYSSGEEYYFLNFKEDGNNLNDIFELRNIENNYIVGTDNIQKIDLYLVDGININGNICYKYEEILAKYNNLFTDR